MVDWWWYGILRNMIESTYVNRFRNNQAKNR